MPQTLGLFVDHTVLVHMVGGSVIDRTGHEFTIAEQIQTTVTHMPPVGIAVLDKTSNAGGAWFLRAHSEFARPAAYHGMRVSHRQHDEGGRVLDKCTVHLLE